ncbi:hypothetical protein CWI75_10335 [Kineobactrum sediminis]|uniref:HTH cro/C1-type domain-containing protein n=1 Tax=Kineobactrum sediminis TaxID=1905677 RepID=A0A2N5Y1A6_9GAMM|nr:helix-turn-helix transcriptional regulator [Kineobactrum sediminis]PLW82177.1 hypothetical protein CWI75_10335 [Kineobactrum sediminis]
MSGYRQAITDIDVSSGTSVRILRELHEMSQHDLAVATGIPQSTISSIENDRVCLGGRRARVLARILRCHVSMLVFQGGRAQQVPVAQPATATDAVLPHSGSRRARDPAHAPVERNVKRERACDRRSDIPIQP